MEQQMDYEEVFNWKRVEETVELAFEEHPHASTYIEDPETKNHDFDHLKKSDQAQNGTDSLIAVSHHEGSKELFERPENISPDSKVEAELEGSFERDPVNNVHLTIQKAQLPTIKVRIGQQQIFDFEQMAAGKDWKMVVEVMFGQRSHSSQTEKYKIFKGGIVGGSAKKFSKTDVMEFKRLKINYHTTVDKNSKIIIALYYLIQNKKKIFREILLSKDLFIIEENKLMNVDNEDALKQYFDLFGSQFMDKLPNPVRIPKGDKHTLHEEINKIEQYLLKKNKRFLNVVFLSFKFPHFCELYFKLPDNAKESELQDSIAFKRTALSNCLTNTIKAIDQIQYSSMQQPQMLCNHSNLNASLIFRINVNLRRVRIFIRKEFTDLLNIIVGQDYDIPDGYAKFETAKELKQFYLDYYSYAKKCKGSQNVNRASPHGVHDHPGSHAMNPSHQLPPKKLKRADDDEYHEQQNEEYDDSEVEDSREVGNYDKKPKKQNVLLKKLYANNSKKPNIINTPSPRQNKYPTRVKTRAQQYMDSPNHDKNSALNRKKLEKEKEMAKKTQQSNPIMPGLVAGMPSMMNPMQMGLGQMGQGPMPFQMMSGVPQATSSGLFPLAQSAQKKDGTQAGAAQKAAPQMIPIAMPGGMPMFGNIPGFNMGSLGAAGMTPVQMGMQGSQAGQKKQGGKEGKDDSSANKGVQMMPMQGMGMPMMGGMGPGSQLIMTPNGQLISLPMGQLMPQFAAQPGQAGQPGNGQQGGVILMPMAGSPGQLGAQGSQANSSASSAQTGQQPNTQALQMMMMGGRGIPMMIGGGGQQGAGGMQGMMIPPHMMGMMGGQGQINPQMAMLGSGQNQNSNSTQVPGNDLGAFSGNNIGMEFMMPIPGQGQNPTQAQKPQKMNPNSICATEAAKPFDSKKAVGKEGTSVSNEHQAANLPKSSQSSNLPSFLAPHSGQTNPLTSSGSQPKQANAKGSNASSAGKNPLGMSQQSGFPGMPMMNGGTLTPEILQQIGQGGQGMPMGMLPGMQSSQQQTQPQQPQSIQTPASMRSTQSGNDQPQMPTKLTPEALNNMTNEQKMMLQIQMQMGGVFPLGIPSGVSGMPGFMGPKKNEQKK